MTDLKKVVLLFLLLLILPGNTFQRIDYRKGINNNVCKSLKDNVLLYFIFIDSQETTPWTEFDIKSTLDSLTLAVQWIEKQAASHGISLNIIQDYYIGTDYTTIKRPLPGGTVYKSLNEPSLHKGIQELNSWADAIAKRVGATFNITEKDGIPEVKNPRNKERLVAFLRDEKQVESVALLFMVNNYFKNDISVAVNTMGHNDVEFAIVSYKYPAVIARNILQLFGASELSKSPFRRNDKKIALAKEFFRADIMQETGTAGIEMFEIGELTKYLIGWSPNLDPKYMPLLTDKIIFY
ncbi:MAG: hypothetical protein JXB00_14920 [Bacteroidales bacterium]|nr:hypothetical protein [Bacteroidales bacterium]